ncbi:MAG: CoA ester lyase [Balneolaceae bacterium]|nr:CoA ester lyase [Balneolaceae bacterium]MBO6546945.1 CoA ester lyase [Balneolaceae bacterium]MBO6649305.1 CoA ester lyase [Balneolaceae bacterium]
MINYLFRSLMFVPAHNERLLNSAVKSYADILLLDIEDSVQPSSNKEVARKNIKEYVMDGKFEGKVLFPRVNDRESGELLSDVLELTIEGVAGFMYPKSKTGKDVYFFSKLLETIEYQKNIPIGTFKIIPLIETAAAVLNIQEICTASDRVVAVSFGSEDFISDLQGIHDHDDQSLFTARSLISMGARACNVIPIDTVHVRVHDLEDLEKNIIVAKNLGFEGMLVLNPKELPIIHDYYTPNNREVEDAKEMLKLSEEAKKSGKGVAIMNGKFIGPPMVLKAKSILKKHSLIVAKKE